MKNRVNRVVRKHLFILLRFINSYSNLDLKVTVVDETLSTAREKMESIKEEEKTEIRFEHIQYLSSAPI